MTATTHASTPSVGATPRRRRSAPWARCLRRELQSRPCGAPPMQGRFSAGLSSATARPLHPPAAISLPPSPSPLPLFSLPFPIPSPPAPFPLLTPPSPSPSSPPLLFLP